jgi:hypothetical protein
MAKRPTGIPTLSMVANETRRVRRALSVHTIAVKTQ